MLGGFVGVQVQHAARIHQLVLGLRAMAEEPKPEGTPAATPPKETAADDDGFVTKLRKVLPDLLDEILGKEEGEPEAKPGPKTDRQVEQSLRDQVAATIRELEEERKHTQEHEALRQPAAPQAPEPEIKPWRNRLWGGE